MRRLVDPGNGPRHVLSLAMTAALVFTSGALALAAAVPAAAAARGSANQIEAVMTPRISASPSTAAPLEAITVRGVGFATADPVFVHLNSPTGPDIGTAFPNHEGSFSRPTSVPHGTKPGVHKIFAVQFEGKTASTTITVS
jgi:hypothetical protein